MRRPVARRRRVLFLAGAALALLGAIAGALSWYRPVEDPYFVPLWITEYESPLFSVSAEAESDREAFRAGAYFVRVDEDAFASQERHLLVQKLNGLRALASNDVLVLYLSAFARGREGGGVDLFPADANPDAAETWLPLRDVLKAVADCPARRKLLVLDVMRPLANARLGVLEDRVASLAYDEVQQTLRTLSEPERLGLVLCACAPGQVALASEDLKRTVFGYYFEEGLGGWADGYNPRNERNGRVSVRELAEFLRARVDRWASNNQGVRQTPVLLGSGPDFPLRALAHARPEAQLALPAAEAYAPWLLDAWKLRDAWIADGSGAMDPRLLNQLEASLLRAESRWRGGDNRDRVKDLLRDRLEFLNGLRAQAQAVIPRPAARSIADSLAQGQKPDPAVETSLRDLLVSVAQQVSGLKLDEAAKVEEKLGRAFLEKQKAKPHLDLAAAAFAVAVADVHPTPDSIRFLDRMLGWQQPRPMYWETDFLRRLARLADERGEEAWPAQVIHRALVAVQGFARAASRPRAFAWVQPLLDRAAGHFQQGQVLLFARGYAPIAAADAALSRAADELDLVLSFQDAVEHGLRVRDRAFRLIPAYRQYLHAHPDREQAWQTAAAAARGLDAAAVPPADADSASVEQIRQRVDRIRQQADQAEFLLQELVRPFTAARVAALAEQSRARDATVAQALAMDAVLATPLPAAEDRARLWTAARGLSRRFAARSLEADAAEEMRFRATAVHLDFQGERAHPEQKQKQAATLRAREEITVLELGDLAAARIADLRSTLATGSLDAVADALRVTLVDRLPQQIERTGDLRVRDRLSRVLPPFDPMPLTDHPETNPTVQLRRQEQLAALRWKYAYFRYASAGPGPAEFSAETAALLQPFARGVQPESLRIDALSQVAGLTFAQPTAACTLRLTLHTTIDAKPVVEVGIVTADEDWLRVVPDLAGIGSLGSPGAAVRSCSLPLSIQLRHKGPSFRGRLGREGS